MIGGPLLVRELLTLPRQPRHFGLRSGYVAALSILIYTGMQVTAGLSPLQSVGDISSFGAYIFSVLCTFQLALVTGASLLFSAGNVAQEKDRRTLILLLMTDLRATELVIGKSIASILPVLILIAVSLPVLCCLRMLGGITTSQVLWVQVICLVTCFAASAWGTLVAYWREKTFQILAVSFLGAGLFIGLAETISVIAGPETILGTLAGSCDPFRALSNILHPLASNPNSVEPVVEAWNSVFTLGGLTIAIWTFTSVMVRVWNPSRAMFLQAQEAAPESEEVAAPTTSNTKGRTIWQQPILWREICTQAYGRKVGIIKAAYVLFALFCLLWVSRTPSDAPLVFGALSSSGLVLVVLSLVTFILVNAQSVTSLTSERDGQTLELLLVTEVSAQEFVFGKLLGVLFNTKELIAIPILMAMMSFFRGEFGVGPLICILLAYSTLVLFSAMLGLHSGFSFTASKSAIINSLGTMFFLFVGIFVCMMLIVEARTSFILQLIPFLGFICGGAFGLWRSLTHQNPAQALTLAAWGLPFLTFYAVVSFLLQEAPESCIAVLLAYGGTTIAMLVPAISAFDEALGRTSSDRG
ncbi:ABC transporter permease [Planctomicrobium sp. SH668]|uniref:ABC transporter permease n=1 Tax=Planctomicrobium sp. SH668 TaxID=3448126 RepID=UPI003F5C5BEC